MATEPENHHHPKNKHPYRFYWLTGGLATIIAAIIAVSVTHASSGTSSSSSGTSSSSPGPSSSSPGPSNSSPGPTPSSPVALVWHHNVRFPYETGLDLNDNQPNVQSMVNSDFNTANFGDNTIPAFSLWRGKAGTVSKPDPTFSDCMNSFVSQAQGDSILSRVGQSVCFESQDGTRVAAVTVLAWNNNTWAMYADVKVWQTNGP